MFSVVSGGPMKPSLCVALFIANLSFADDLYLRTGFVFRNVHIIDTTGAVLNYQRDGTLQHLPLRLVVRIDVLTVDPALPSKYELYSNDVYLAYKRDSEKEFQPELREQASKDSISVTKRAQTRGGGECWLVTTSQDTIFHCKFDSVGILGLYLSSEDGPISVRIRNIAILHYEKSISHFLAIFVGAFVGFFVGEQVGHHNRGSNDPGALIDLSGMPVVACRLLGILIGAALGEGIAVTFSKSETYDLRGRTDRDKIAIIQDLM
jgi:hypothetical protein